MPSPAEYKTVQARILQYAQEIGWMYVTRQEPNVDAVSVLLEPQPKSGRALIA
jgi:hypothetical protein